MSRWNIFNPLYSIKLWTISFDNFGHGIFRSFWFKKNAKKCYETKKHGWLFITLKNEWYKKTYTLKNNPDKVKQELFYFSWATSQLRPFTYIKPFYDDIVNEANSPKENSYGTSSELLSTCGVTV